MSVQPTLFVIEFNARHDATRIPRSPGVYRIRNLLDGRGYVGSAAESLWRRWRSHLNCLTRRCHSNRHLQRAFDRHGAGAFVFEVLDFCEPSECVGREQDWIDRLDVCNPRRGYNISPVAGSTLGVKHTEEAKKNFGNSRRGKPLSPQHRDAMVAAVRRAYADPAVRANATEVNRARMAAETAEERACRMRGIRGKPLSAKHRAAISRARKGMTLSPAARKKVSEAHRGRKLTPEHKAKIAEGNKGRVPSPDALAKMIATKRERCRTPEFRAKMSEVVRLQWIERRKKKASQNAVLSA